MHRRCNSAWSVFKHYATQAGSVLGRRGAGLADRARQFIGRTPGSACGCFTSGTVVWTLSGLVPIEQVEVGDIVFTHDEEAKAPVLGTVTDLIVTEGAALLELTVRHESGDLEVIETTDEHPFWREAGGNIAEGWMRADGLAPCDRVRTLSGSAVVESVRFLSERTTVYNLTVTSDPSYLIGDDGLWVHNCSNFRQIFIETFEATGRKFPENHHVHHRIPQKYRELFPDEVDDISNWVGVPEKVHGRINGRWNTFRAKHKNPSNEEIRSFVAEIDLEFSQYYLTP